MPRTRSNRRSRRQRGGALTPLSWGSLSKNGDGELTKDTWKGSEASFAEADTNGNGTLNQTEYDASPGISQGGGRRRRGRRTRRRRGRRGGNLGALAGEAAVPLGLLGAYAAYKKFGKKSRRGRKKSRRGRKKSRRKSRR
jgi:hypothetical protein